LCVDVLDDRSPSSSQVVTCSRPDIWVATRAPGLTLNSRLLSLRLALALVTEPQRQIIAFQLTITDENSNNSRSRSRWRYKSPDDRLVVPGYIYMYRSISEQAHGPGPFLVVKTVGAPRSRLAQVVSFARNKGWTFACWEEEAIGP